MSAEYVQGAHDTATGAATIAVAFATDVSENSLIVVGLSWTDTTKTVSSVVDSLGNTYAAVSAKVTTTGVALQTWYAKGASEGATTVTVTFDAAVNSSMMVLEYSGISPTAEFHKAASATGAGTPADSSLTDMTSCGDMLVFGILGLGAGATDLDPGPGFTQREQMVRLMGLEKIVAVDGAYNATASWTEAEGTDVAWCCQIAIFEAYDEETPPAGYDAYKITFRLGLGLTSTYLPVIRAHPSEMGFVYSSYSSSVQKELTNTWYPLWTDKFRALVGLSLTGLSTVGSEAAAAGLDYDVLCYNLESNGEESELEDVVGSCAAAAAIAATYSKPLMIAFGGALWDEHRAVTADPPGDGLIDDCAAHADYWLLQAQRQQIYAPGETYKSEVAGRLAEIVAANASCKLLVQISDWRGHYGGLMTSAEMYEYLRAFNEMVNEESLTIEYVNLYDNKDTDSPAILHGVVDLFATPRLDNEHVAAPYWQPAAYVQSDASPGKILEMADGSVRRHWAAPGLLKFDIQWKGITSAEVDALWAWYKAQSSTALWEDVEGGAYTVRPVPRTWRWASVTVEGGYAYNVQFSIQGTEVT